MNKYIIISLTFLLFGCSKILEPVPQGQIPLSGLFVDEPGAISAVIGAYQPLLSSRLYDGSLKVMLSYADDDNWNWRAEPQADIYTMDPSSSYLEIWDACYAGVTRSNTILERSSTVNFSSVDMKNAVFGQAHFLRAFYYFHLVRIFGRVPLIVNEVIVRQDAEKPRSEIPDVYTVIKDDLLQAAKLLPANYNNFQGGFSQGLATKFSATALKVLVHLELEEWDAAATDASTIINSNQYSLHTDYSMNFFGKAENGVESLFEVQFGGVDQLTGSSLSNLMAPPTFQGLAAPLPTDKNFANYSGFGSDGRTGALGDAIIQEFEPADLRLNVAVSNYGLPNFLDPLQPVGSLMYINKYYNAAATPGLSTYNYPLIRLSEIYLARAEALNELGANNATAKSDIGIVRARAGLGTLDQSVYNNMELFRQAIRKERRTELCFETKRYFDLNRWGILRSTMATQGVTVPVARVITHPITNKEYHLYPIPEAELVNNPNLKGDQNPGY